MSKVLIAKVWRFFSIYGPRRTIFKVAGRTRRPIPLVWRRHRSPDIAMIGCGQYAFATLGYFITREFGRRIRWCYDVRTDAAQSFSKTLGVQAVAETAERAIEDEATRIVYIASNHASHAHYAVQALKARKAVFVEKPVVVNREQFARLRDALRACPGPIYAGYNRPCSKAVRQLRKETGTPTGGLSLSCFVSGHQIPSDHWYRDPNEGTRICGNAGHWIDLFVHILAWRGIPDRFQLQLLSADLSEADDNFAFSVATDAGDVFSLMLTARTEPFEGINETVNFQWGCTIAKIDDFRRMDIWQGRRFRRFRYWPKDVGHAHSALQPFRSTETRDWSEVEISTLLMLRATEMVRKGETMAELCVSRELESLDDWQGNQ